MKSLKQSAKKTTMNNYAIYVHTFPNGKMYVGQSNSPEKRWANGTGYKRQIKIGSAIAKYGWENIRHEIIATNLSKEQANQLEIELIQKLDTTNPNKGYNVSIGGGVPIKIKHTTEHNKKIAEAHKRPVSCYDREGNHIADFESIFDAADWIHGGFRVISSCCNGAKKSAYGYIWRKRGEPFDMYETKNKKGGIKGKPVIVYTVDGKKVGVFESAKMAAKILNVSHSSVCDVCIGKKTHAKQYTFRYLNTDEKLQGVNTDDSENDTAEN